MGNISELHSADPRQNIFYQDLTLEPSQTMEEKEVSRLQKLLSTKNVSYLEQTTTGANIVQIRAPSQCFCHNPANQM